MKNTTYHVGLKARMVGLVLFAALALLGLLFTLQVARASDANLPVREMAPPSDVDTYDVGWPNAPLHPSAVATITYAAADGGDRLVSVNRLTGGDYAPAPNGFGFEMAGAIGNYVWLDENGEGWQGAGESGIPNVIVELWQGSSLVITTTTDADGGYIFTDLAPSSSAYTVIVDTTSLPVGLAANPTYDEDGGTTTPNHQTVVTLQTF